MIKTTINKFFKQRNVCRRLGFHNIKLLFKQQKEKISYKKQLYKKKPNKDELFLFTEFFLYLQYFFIRCTNSFYQVLTKTLSV